MTEPTAPYRNRIIGHGEADPAQLLASPRNWRVHPHFQEQALAATLSEVGWVSEVIVNQRSGFVVDGHLRVAHAISRSEPSVPVAYVDISDAEEALILATFDPITALAGTDAAQLDSLLRDIDTGDAALQQMLDTLAGQNGIGVTDPLAEWKEMPAFEQADLTPVRQIIVSFASTEAVAAFADLVEQKITERTKSLWYPAQPEIDYGGMVYAARTDADAS